MDGLQALDLALFAAGAFAAAFVTGIAGFAFGVVAAAVWLHVLTPVQAAALIVVFGLIVQGWSVWKLRGRAAVVAGVAVHHRRATRRRSAPLDEPD
jgi:uncharacterized protein